MPKHMSYAWLCGNIYKYKELVTNMKRGLEQNSIQLQYIYIVIRQEQYKKMDQLVSNTTVNPGQNNKNTTAQII